MLNVDSLRKKTINQTIRMITGRIQKYKTANKNDQLRILEELHQILQADVIIEKEWYQAVRKAGAMPRHWNFAECGGLKAFRPAKPSKPVTPSKTNKSPAVTPLKQSNPVTPSKDKRGGYRENAGKFSKKQAENHAKPMLKTIRQALKKGLSLQKIAEHLTEEGCRTQEGKLLTRTHIHRLVKRFGLKV